jgi:hypothetical protein
MKNLPKNNKGEVEVINLSEEIEANLVKESMLKNLLKRSPTKDSEVGSKVKEDLT